MCLCFLLILVTLRYHAAYHIFLIASYHIVSLAGEADLPPTPLYNLAVLEDMCVLTQHKILTKTITAKPLADALMLFKVRILTIFT